MDVLYVSFEVINKCSFSSRRRLLYVKVRHFCPLDRYYYLCYHATACNNRCAKVPFDITIVLAVVNPI